MNEEKEFTKGIIKYVQIKKALHANLLIKSSDVLC